MSVLAAEREYDEVTSDGTLEVSYDEPSDGGSSMDGELEMIEGQRDHILRSYAEVFEFEGGLVRSLFEDDFDEQLCETQPDWRYLLHLLADDHRACPVDHGITAPPAPAALGEQRVQHSQPNPPGSAQVGVAQSSDGQWWKLLESPATKRLKAPSPLFCEGVLFSIDSALNRSDLQCRIRSDPDLSSLVNVELLFVGYHFRESAGIALALFEANDAEVCTSRAKLFMSALESRSDMTDGRLLRKDDENALRPFYKVDRIKSSGPSTAATQADTPMNANGRDGNTTPCSQRQTSSMYAEMHDVVKLRTLIAEHGGVSGCRFVAFDCEAAVVTKGALPLPIEMSFVDCVRDLLHNSESCCPPTLHIDPGEVGPGDEVDGLTARMLSLCEVPGGHGVPLRGFAFLRRDYAAMVDDIHRLLFPARKQGDPSPPPRQVILINKGGTMDVQAIRWLFAVDAAVRGSPMGESIPTAQELNMFDVTCLQEALGVDLARDAQRRYDGGADGEATTLAASIAQATTLAASTAQATTLAASIAQAKTDVGRCWYHGDVATYFPSAHCAAKDARALAAVIEKWLH